MNTSPKKAILAASGALAWMGAIFGLSSLPGSAVPGRFGTLAHFVMYAVLGALYLIALPTPRQRWRAVIVAVALASLYGVTDEFHQSFVPGRTPDVVDWLVDTAGATTAAIALHAWRSRAGRTV